VNPSSQPESSGIRPTHWIVRTHYLHRTFLFANAFAFFAAHIWGRQPSLALWALLAVTFLIYPHLVYWRAQRAADTQKAELQNIVLDCFVVAIPTAILGFPLWPTYTLFITTTMNNAFASGMRAVALAFAAFFAGAFVGGALAGFPIDPDTSILVTALSTFALTWFLLSVGSTAYERALKLRSTREELKRRIAEIDTLQVLLREQANRDPLTGLYNRRYLQSTLEREMARSTRAETPLCVMLLDLDLFKSINDRYGHQTGDEVIVAMARMLSGESRQDDVPCRYGGEEFMLLMPKMTLETAEQRAEEWRRRFAMMTVECGGQRIGTTVSIGIAEFPTHGRTAQSLIECADQALYQAKSGGRDRVVSYQRTDNKAYQ
jgi:diguanylate cyclase